MSFTSSAASQIDYTAYCTDDGWTVFQSRGQFGNPADHFFRGWSSYLDGFGTPGEEAWLGLNTIYHLTNLRTYRLRVKVTAPDGSIGVSYYEVFRLENLVSIAWVTFNLCN